MSVLQSPRVSIVIPVYNAARFVSRAIESSLQQTFPGVETVVVNDGSRDNTEEICLSYGGKIVYLLQPNGGPGAARNTGIETATGEILGFLDADDQLAPNMVTDLMKGFAAYPQAGAVSGSYFVLDDSGKGRRLPLPRVMLPNGQIMGLIEHFFLKYTRQNPTCVGAVLVKRSVIETVGGFQEGLNHGEDIEMWSRVAGKFPWVYVDKLVHYYHLSSLTSISQTVKVNVVDEFCRSVFSEDLMRKFVDAEKWDDYRYFRKLQFLACLRYHISRITPQEILALYQHVHPVPHDLKMHMGKALTRCPEGCLDLLGRIINTYRWVKKKIPIW